MFLANVQVITIVLLLVVLIPIACLICVAFVLRFKNLKKSKNVSVDKKDDTSLEEQKEVFLLAYGGSENIVSISQERTKIIVTVNDTEKVDGVKLQELGAKGVLIVDKEVRASFGDRTSNVYEVLTL